MAAFVTRLLKRTGWFGETAPEKDVRNGDLDNGENAAQGKDEENFDSSENSVEVQGTAIFVEGVVPDSDCSSPRSYDDDTIVNREELPEKLHVSPDSVLDESTLDESVLQSYSIEVSGVDKNTSAETVRMYFENQKRSRGGPVDNVWYNAKNGNYVVTFAGSESE